VSFYSPKPHGNRIIHDGGEEPPNPPVSKEPHTGLSKVGETLSNFLYRKTSRRGVMSGLGKAMLLAVGVSVVKTLPLDRIVQPVEASSVNCNLWYYCNINAPRMCICCVASHTECVCPNGSLPGTQWWGCCQDAGGTYRWVQYTDCCNVGDPITCNYSGCNCHNHNNRYDQEHTSGSIYWHQKDWCQGTGSFFCTTACVHTSTC